MFKFLKIASKSLAVFLALLLLLLALINIPAVQTYITTQISERIQEDYGIDFSIGGVKIAIPNTVQLEGVFIPGRETDTLLYFETLSVDVALFALLQNHVNVRYLSLEGLTGNVFRGPPGSDYNFAFLLDAFASEDEVTAVPDTIPAEPWEITIGRIHLKNIDAMFRDETLGMDAKLKLGELEITIDEIDITEPSIFVNRIFLAETTGSFEEWNVLNKYPDETLSGAGEDQITESANLLPDIGLREFMLQNVHFSYFHHNSKLKMNYETGHLLVEPGNTNLPDKQINAENIEIAQSKVFISVESDTTNKVVEENPKQQISESQNSPDFAIVPGWDIQVKEVSLEEVDFGFDDSGVPPKVEGMDFAHLLFKDINIDIEDVTLSDSLVAAHIRRISMTEQSGLKLDQLQLEGSLTEKHATVNGLVLELDDNQLDGDILAGYADFGSVFTNPGDVTVDIDLTLSRFKPDILYRIMGTQVLDSSLAGLRNEQISLYLEAHGKADSLRLKKLHFQALDKTEVIVSGQISNITQPDDLTYDLRLDTIRTGKVDMNLALGKIIPRDINLPDEIFGSLTAVGSITDAKSELTLETDYGAVSADVFFARASQQATDTFSLQLSLGSLLLGQILNNGQVGEVSLALSASGSGLESGKIHANAFANIYNASYNGYKYGDIAMEANMQDSLIWMKMISNDPNALFTLETSASIDTTVQDISVALNVRNLDLYPLHFTDEKLAIKTAMDFSGYFNNINDMGGELTIENSFLISENGTIPLKKIRFLPEFSPQYTKMDFTSGILNFNFDSNIPFNEFGDVVTASVNQYLGNAVEDTIDPDKYLNFSASIVVNEDFKTYILPDLNKIALDTIVGYYAAMNNSLGLKIHVPSVNYANVVLDNLYLDLTGNNDSILLIAGFDKLAYDSLFVNALSIEESIVAGKVFSNFLLNDENGEIEYRFANKIILTENETGVSFLPDGLVLNGEPWKVSPKNQLLIGDSGWVTNDFVFSSNEQKVGIASENQTARFFTEQFEISNFLGMVQGAGRENLAEGNLNLLLSIPFNRQYDGINADIHIQELHVLDNLIGDLRFTLVENTDELEMDFQLDASMNQLNASGTIGKTLDDQPLDLHVNLDISDPARFDPITAAYVSDMNGRISGDFEIGGTVGNPIITGYLQFNESGMTITPFNAEFYLPDERIDFTTSGIAFNGFDIYDSQNNKLNVNGNLITSNYSDIDFDLKINTQNFKPINSTKSDNKVLYGSLVIDADLELKGDLDLPVVDASLAMNEGTDLTYVLPGSEIELVSADGIVNFVDHATDTLFEMPEGDYLTDSILSKVAGIDLTAQLDLSPKAKFTVVIDPYSGDYASVQGGAKMNFTIDPSGSKTLTGIFEVAEGVYQLSFYGLVKKTFEFEPGSTIAWSGRPMDANMNFTARHVVRTQSLALVANESSGMTEAEKNMFRQRLPFEVLLNLRGFLDEPDVGFRIELPEKYQINYPQVASKLNMLNSGQNDSELNKQVFALLVTGSFIADNPFASSGGSAENFATTAARNSVNGILAQQLNNVSSRYIKGVDMNFGLTTYEDYAGSSSQTRTELDVKVSKRLLDDRLTVEATGSFDVEGTRQYTGTNTSYTYGEFSATYDLTENREYKLRAYHENAYDLFDGEISYSGIAFIIEKSFDTLFKRTKPKDSTDQEGMKPDEPEPEDMGGEK